MTGDYCINCKWADVYYGDQYATVFCQKRLKNIIDITDAILCQDFQLKETQLER